MTMIEMPVDERVASDAAAVFGQIGLDVPTAVGIFLRVSIRNGGLPFEVSDDPFYSEANMAHLNRVREDWKKGVNFHEHELVEVPDEEAVAR